MYRPLLLFSLIISAAAHGGHSDDDTSSMSEEPNLRSRPLILVKIWCLILVFIGTFVGGVSPYFLKWNEGFLVIGTQFAGGVFLGTALMHFLSDSNETFGDLTDKEYPFAFMLACVGYLLTMFADCLISLVFRKQSSNGAVETQDNEKGSGNGITSSQHQDGHDHHHHHASDNPFLKAAPAAAAATSLGDSVLLIVALCFHSVFEGIAIGVSDTKSAAWRALWTVSLHKVFAAVAMGIALLRMMPDRPLLSCVAYAFAFAISSPVGVAVGIAVDATTQGHVADWVFAVSMGVACGVFLYVSINHLLSKGYVAKEKVGVDGPMCKFLAVVFGVGVIAVVMIWDT